MEYILLTLLSAFISAWVLTKITPVARRWGFVDQPCHKRHLHDNPIPLVGGLPLLFFAAIGWLFYSALSPIETLSIIAAALLLFVTGAMDDRKPIKPNYRFASHILAASVLVVQLDLSINHLGLIYSQTPVELGAWNTFFTVFAVVGLINAFNMIDGLNGLSSGLAIISMTFLAGFLPIDKQFLALILTAILTFILFNLRLLGKSKQVFLGDSGSTLLGLIVAWFALEAFQTNQTLTQLSPMGILMIIALPVIDTLAVMVRRAVTGYSVFVADKKHLHHILLLLHQNERMVLIWMLLLSIGFALLGRFQAQIGISDTFLFNLFIITVIGHIWLLKLAHQVLVVRQQKKHKRPPQT